MNFLQKYYLNSITDHIPNERRKLLCKKLELLQDDESSFKPVKFLLV